MVTLLQLYACFLSMHYVACVCENGTKPCEWEPWQPWSSCSRTCGVGYRTRNSNLCCGPVLKDCSSVCHRGEDNKQVEVCNHSCPNGATLVDGICQCPPLKYGTCCDIDEAEAKEGGIGCARHCTLLNWYSWGDCSTNCGCGTRERTRSRCCKTSLTSTQCTDDCSFAGRYTGIRPCTTACSSKRGQGDCSLCSWNNWGSWSSCSSTCGGGEMSRTRTPCCCSGQTVDECVADCGLSVMDAIQKKVCNQLCLYSGSFTNSSCACETGFNGSCCSTEVLVSDCKKCSWQTWQAWEETGEDGKMRRRRELCCRVGQSPEDCRSECGVEEYSQVQILLNNEITSDHQTFDNTTTEPKQESSHTDLHLYLYAVGISLASVVVTSLAWVGCYHLKKKRKVAEENRKTLCVTAPDKIYGMNVSDHVVDHQYSGVDHGSITASDNVYEMSVSDHVMDHQYSDVDHGSVTAPDNVYEMSVSDHVMDHQYSGVDPISDGGEEIYANSAFIF